MGYKGYFGVGVAAGWHRHSYLARQLHVACGYTLPSGLACRKRKRKSQKPGLELQLEAWHSCTENNNTMVIALYQNSYYLDL